MLKPLILYAVPALLPEIHPSSSLFLKTKSMLPWRRVRMIKHTVSVKKIPNYKPQKERYCG